MTTEKKVQYTSMVSILLVLAIKLIETSYPFGHGDALYYHLPLGKLWVEGGLADAHENLCGAMTTGYFEYIMGLPQFIFESTLTRQIIGQYMHMFASIIFPAALVFIYFRRKQMTLGLLGALSFLTIGISNDFLLYAKNDGAMASLILLVAILITDDNFAKKLRGNLRAIVVGLLLGVIPAVKLTGLIYIAPMSLFYCYKNRKTPSLFLLAGACALLSWSPILYRNWFWLKNPFFPGFLSTFPEGITKDIKDTYAYFLNSEVNISSILKNIRVYFLGKALCLLIPIILILKRSKIKELKGIQILIFSTTSLALYIFQNGGIYAPRFLFPIIFLNIYFVLSSLEKLEFQTRYLWLILIIIFADSKIDKSFRRILTLPVLYSMEKNALLEKQNNNTTIWRHIKPHGNRTWIISDEFNEIFHSTPGIRLHSTKCNPQAQFILDCQTGDDFQKLSKYQYAILKRNVDNLCYRKIRTSGQVYKVRDYELYDLSRIFN